MLEYSHGSNANYLTNLLHRISKCVPPDKVQQFSACMLFVEARYIVPCISFRLLQLISA